MEKDALTFTPVDDPRRRIEVEIGDTKDTSEFQPQAKMMQWDNEVNLSARVANFGNFTVDDSGEKIKLKNGSAEVHLYDIPAGEGDYEEGGYEVEIILPKKPKSNKIRFTLEFKNLTFYRQHPFYEMIGVDKIASANELGTEGYDKDGKLVAYQPENVVGSYAVYYVNHPLNIKGGKLYKVGKAFHIFRPRIEDSAGNWTWGELHIDARLKLMTVTIPQKFLDNAVYPIRHAAGATFGYNTIGAGHGGSWANGEALGSLQNNTASLTGSVDDISLACFSSGNNVKFFMQSLSGGTYAILTNGIAGATTTLNGWRTLTYSTKPNVTNGNDYVPSAVFGSGTTQVKRDTGAGSNTSYELDNNYTTPTAFAGESTSTNIYSIYATYTSSGYTLTCDQGSFALTGQAATLTAGRKLEANKGDFALTGYAAAFSVGVTLACDQGSFVLTGQDLNFSRDYAITCAQGSFSLTGIAVSITVSNRTLECETGYFVLSGTVVAFTVAEFTITFEGLFNGSDWEDFSADVLAGWELFTGFKTVRPDKLMCDIGTLSLELNNSAKNSAGLAGLYSPGHANQKTGFTKRLPVRVKTVYGSEITYYKYYIRQISPDMDTEGPRRTYVFCQDKIVDMARKNVGLLAVQTDVRSDELLDLIVADLVDPPDNTNFAVGLEAFAAAFTDIQSEKMKLLALINHVLRSDWSRMVMLPDATDGETLTTFTRSYGAGSSEITLDNSMVEVEPILDADEVISRVNITAYPSDVDADEETIFTLQNEIRVGPGETKSFKARFTDVNTGERICAANVVTALVAGTHYAASSQAGDNGTDMNSSASPWITSAGTPVGADRAVAYIKNNDSTYALYLNVFDLKGAPIRRRDTYEYSAVSSDIEDDEFENTLNIKMHYASDESLPDLLAAQILSDWGSEDNVNAERISFVINTADDHKTLAFNKKLGTKITYQEDQSSLDKTGLVMGKIIRHEQANIYKCTVIVDRRFGVAGWELGTAGKSEIGETTELGF